MPLPAPRRREPRARVGVQNQNDAGARSTDRPRLARDATLPTGSLAATGSLSLNRFPDRQSGRHPRLRPAGPATLDGQTTFGPPVQSMSRCPQKKMANDAAGNMPLRPHRKSGIDRASRLGAKHGKTIPTRRIFSVRARGRPRQNLAHGALPGCAVTVFSVFWRTRGFSSGQTLLSCCRGAQETVASTGSSHRTNKWFGYLPCGHGFMGCRFAHHVDEFGDGRHQSLPGLNYYLSLHELGCDGPVNLTSACQLLGGGATCQGCRLANDPRRFE